MITVKYKFQAVLLFLMILPLVSCATSLITNDRIQTIEHGMNYERFKSMIVREPVSRLLLQHEGFSYSVEIYPMQTGTQRYYDYYYYTKYGQPIRVYTYPVSEDYLFIFDSDGLIFWGFLNELHKEEDKLIQHLAPLISEQYEREKLQ